MPHAVDRHLAGQFADEFGPFGPRADQAHLSCLLYTSDAADERSSVDLGGRRIIKKKKSATVSVIAM